MSPAGESPNFRRELGGGVLLYLGLVVVATWPAAAHLRSAIIGNDQSDMWKHIWGCWWFRWSLFTQHEPPLFCHLLNHPLGGYLYFADPLTALLTLPLQPLLGLVAAYNLLLLGHLVAGAAAAHALARDRGLRRGGAFLAGTVYAMSPYALSYCVGSGVLETANLAWIPLYLLFLGRALRGGRPAEETVADAVKAGVFLFLTAFSCWYYAEFALVMTALVLLFGGEETLDGEPVRFRMGRRRVGALRRLGERIRRALPALGVGLALIFPFATTFEQVVHNPYNIVMPAGSRERSAATFNTYLGRGWWSENAQGQVGAFNYATLAGYFLPGKDESIVTVSIDRLTRASYLGWLALALALLGLASARRPWSGSLRFWTGAALFFLVMALGPHVHASNDARSVICTSWPYLALYYGFPLFQQVAHPYRMLVLAYLSLGILAGMGLDSLASRWPRAAAVTVPLAVAAVLGETLLMSPTPYPMPTAPGEVPAIYHVLAEVSGTGAVLDIPWERPGTRLVPGEYYYYQTVHHKPIPYRTSGVVSDPITQNGLHMAIQDLLAGRPVRLAMVREGLAALRALQVRYLVVHGRILGPRLAGQVNRLLTRSLRRRPIREGDLTLYRVY